MCVGENERQWKSGSWPTLPSSGSRQVIHWKLKNNSMVNYTELLVKSIISVYYQFQEAVRI